MLPDIHRATQKFYIFLIVYLTGCTPFYLLWASIIVGVYDCANQNLEKFIIQSKEEDKQHN